MGSTPTPPPAAASPHRASHLLLSPPWYLSSHGARPRGAHSTNTHSIVAYGYRAIAAHRPSTPTCPPHRYPPQEYPPQELATVPSSRPRRGGATRLHHGARELARPRVCHPPAPSTTRILRLRLPSPRASSQ